MFCLMMMLLIYYLFHIETYLVSRKRFLRSFSILISSFNTTSKSIGKAFFFFFNFQFFSSFLEPLFSLKFHLIWHFLPLLIYNQVLLVLLLAKVLPFLTILVSNYLHYLKIVNHFWIGFMFMRSH